MARARQASAGLWRLLAAFDNSVRKQRLWLWCALLGQLGCVQARADIFEPEVSLIPLSVKPYFIMGSDIPTEERFAFYSKKYAAITSVVASSTAILQNAEAIMNKPTSVCSAYYSSSCYNVRSFYQPRFPQFILSGFYAADTDTILNVAVNSGFKSEKVTVGPSIMLGIAKRFYVGDVSRQNSHVIFEMNAWLAGSVDHQPCYDSFDRAYYCGTLTSWSDFSYTAAPASFNFIAWYETHF